MKVIQCRKDSLFNKWYWNSLSFIHTPPQKKLNLDLTSKLIQLDHTCKYKMWNHKAVTRKHRTTGSPYPSCFRDKEGSIFFQITLLPCSGYPENAASHLGLASGQGRESQSRRMVLPPSTTFCVPQGAPFPSILVRKRGSFLKHFLSTLAVQSLDLDCPKVWAGRYGMEKVRKFTAIWVVLQDLISLPNMPGII